jgi:hypothetical protein
LADDERKRNGGVAADFHWRRVEANLAPADGLVCSFQVRGKKRWRTLDAIYILNTSHLHQNAAFILLTTHHLPSPLDSVCSATLDSPMHVNGSTLGY